MPRREFPQGVTADSISLRIGHPDPTTLNTSELRAAVASILTTPESYQALEYGAQQGVSSLIGYLVGRINREQGLSLQPDQLMLTTGSTGAVDMIARLHKGAGGSVIVEAPSYADTLHVFRDHGLPLYSVPTDEQGIDAGALLDLLERLKPSGAPLLLYTIPNFQNPSGVTLSESRRREILALARQYNVLIVEDDVYRDLYFDAAPPPSFLALADGVEVLQIGSFSKTLGPAFRLGWLAGSPDAIRRYVNCGTYDMGGGASPFSAHIITEYCRLGHWEPHIAALRERYRRRRDTLIVALRRSMPAGVSWIVPGGGYFVWVTLPPMVQASQVVAEAQARGVMISNGEWYFLDPQDGRQNLRLAFSFAPPEDIDRAIAILADVVTGVISIQ
jgi:2-aminoadipate transaminase